MTPSGRGVHAARRAGRARAGPRAIGFDAHQRPHGGNGTGSSRLKHISTTVTTTEIWLPFLGWTVVCETVKVKCGPGGNNCPSITPQA